MKEKKRIMVHGLAGFAKGGIESFILEMEKYLSNDFVFDYVIEKGTGNVLTSREGEVFQIEPKRHPFSNIACL